jgi:Tol biopolymer transport system component
MIMLIAIKGGAFEMKQWKIATLVILYLMRCFQLANAQGEKPSCPTWSPDGTKIAFEAFTSVASPTTNDKIGIFVINADGTNLVNISGDNWDMSPAWSPDGKWIAFTHCPEGDLNRSQIWLMTPQGTNRRRVLTDPVRLFNKEDCPEWSPDGSKLLCVVSRSYESPYDDNPMLILVNPFTGEEIRSFNITTGARWSPDGKKLAYMKGGCIWIYDLQKDTDERLTGRFEPYPAVVGDNLHLDFSPSWSPDGTKIVYVTTRFGHALPRLAIINADGTNPHLLLDDPDRPDEETEHIAPAWSPDGKRIVFARYYALYDMSKNEHDEGWLLVEDQQLFLINPDGTGLKQLTKIYLGKIPIQWRNRLARKGFQLPEGGEIKGGKNEKKKAKGNFVPKEEEQIINASFTTLIDSSNFVPIFKIQKNYLPEPIVGALKGDKIILLILLFVALSALMFLIWQKLNKFRFYTKIK